MEVAAKLDSIRAKAKAKRLPKLSVEVLSFALVILATIALMLWRLAALTNSKLSQSELATKHQLYLNSPWWKSIAHLYGPYYLLLHTTFAAGHNVFAFRLASVICAILLVGLIYWLASTWHGHKIALMVAAIALTNFGILAAARSATPIITQLLMVVAVLAAIVILNLYKDVRGLIVFSLSATFCLYVPGGIWFALCACFIARSDIKEAWTSCVNKYKAYSTILALLVLTPIAYRLIRHYSLAQLKLWLGYSLSGKPLHILKSFGLNFIRTPLDVFFRSSNLSANLSLGHLALLPIAISLLVAIGLFCYVTRLKNWRWRAVLSLLILSWLLSGLGAISPLVLVPLLIITSGTGLAYLLRQWYAVFPRNPLARAAGLLLLSAVIVLCAYYSARSYIVGWGNDPAVQSHYTRSLN